MNCIEVVRGKVCGKPVSPKDGIDDRCGHHRRAFLRNQARPPKPPKPPKEERMSPLEMASPAQLRAEHLTGEHDTITVLACVLCVRRNGGRIDHVEMIRET